MLSIPRLIIASVFFVIIAILDLKTDLLKIKSKSKYNKLSVKYNSNKFIILINLNSIIGSSRLNSNFQYPINTIFILRLCSIIQCALFRATVRKNKIYNKL